MENILKEISIESTNLKQMIFLVVLLMLIDVVTGVLNAVLQKELNSTKMKNGIVGKIYEMLIICVVIMIDRVLPIKQIKLPYITCIFYITQEGLSIIENTGKYIPYPQMIKDLFVKLKDLSKNKNEMEDK